MMDYFGRHLFPELLLFSVPFQLLPMVQSIQFMRAVTVNACFTASLACPDLKLELHFPSAQWGEREVLLVLNAGRFGLSDVWSKMLGDSFSPFFHFTPFLLYLLLLVAQLIFSEIPFLLLGPNSSLDRVLFPRLIISPFGQIVFIAEYYCFISVFISPH